MGDIMSKEIYIKKGPESRKLTKEEMMEFLETCVPPEEIEQLKKLFESIGKNFYEFVDEAASIDGEFGAFKEVWDGCNNFWTCTEDKNGVVMHEHTLDGEGMEKRYESKVHAYQDFTSINFFLESATYIGKFFRRTKRVFNEDAEYLPVNHNIFALYELDGVILVVKPKNGKTVFDIISTQFTRDGNFEYYGSQKDIYNDKKTINKEIVKQLKK